MIFNLELYFIRDSLFIHSNHFNFAENHFGKFIFIFFHFSFAKFSWLVTKQFNTFEYDLS